MMLYRKSDSSLMDVDGFIGIFGNHNCITENNNARQILNWFFRLLSLLTGHLVVVLRDNSF